MTKAKRISTAKSDLASTLRDIAGTEEIDRKALKKAAIRCIVITIADDPSDLKAIELLSKIMGWGADKRPQEDQSSKEAMTKRLDAMLAAVRANPDSHLTMPVTQGPPAPMWEDPTTEDPNRVNGADP